ncbi:MAG: hypothetical protein MMC23_007365 [Stictis urceolatum]|nr:hypothetical protein [Stictis urceolata]
MATAPAVSAANELISPPTDAETLTMYIPPDARSSEINAHLTSHPLALSLRASTDFVESRPYFKIPESARDHFLTGGVLSGPGKIWVPPLAFAERNGKSMTILYYLGEDVSGHPGVVHGGLLATLLDEALARCSFGALPNKVGMTANLNIDYRRPMPTDSYVVARAELERVEGRKAWVRGWLESADAGEDGERVKFVEAKGLFIEPRQAATMKRLYPAATSST